MIQGTRPTILIVEDDAGVAALEQRRLERAGYGVVTAAGPAEAMAQLARQRFALILLDYRLPGEVDGLTFYTQVKAAGYDLPVILVTAFANDTASRLCNASSASERAWCACCISPELQRITSASPWPGTRITRSGTQTMSSRTTGRASADGSGRVDIRFIWSTACPVVVGPSGIAMAPPSRQPAAVVRARRRSMRRASSLMTIQCTSRRRQGSPPATRA